MTKLAQKGHAEREESYVRSGAWVEMWTSLSSEQGKRSVQDRQTHFMPPLQSRALLMEAVIESSCGNPFTGAASPAVWKGWIISPGCFAWRDIQWKDIFSHQSWVAAARSVCSPLRAHLQAGTAAPARRVWLPPYCGCQWYEWTDTPRFFLRSVQIHSCKYNEGLWERAGTHE